MCDFVCDEQGRSITQNLHTKLNRLSRLNAETQSNEEKDDIKFVIRFQLNFLLKSQFSTLGDTTHDSSQHTQLNAERYRYLGLLVEIFLHRILLRSFYHSQRTKCCAIFTLCLYDDGDERKVLVFNDVFG